MDHFVIITGCSGGGKSALLSELARRGHRAAPEPGRRLIQAGRADPYADLIDFAQQAIALSLVDMEKRKEHASWVFFDRGLIDAAVTLEHAGGAPIAETLSDQPRFCSTVFFAPPWPEIFRQDQERLHSFQSAEEEAARLKKAYKRLGYQLAELPKTSVEDRADWVVRSLETHR